MEVVVEVALVSGKIAVQMEISHQVFMMEYVVIALKITELFQTKIEIKNIELQK